MRGAWVCGGGPSFKVRADKPLAASCSLLQPLASSCILLHPLCAWFHSVGYAYSHSDSYRLCRFVFAKHTTDRAMGKSKKAKKLANLRGPLVSQASKPKKKNRKSLAKPPASPQTPMVKTPPAVPVNPQLPPNAPSCPVARPPTINAKRGAQPTAADRSSTNEDTDGITIVNHERREAGIGHAILGEALQNEGGDARLFDWLVYPVQTEQFFQQHWETQPLYIQRPQSRSYYDGWFSSSDLLGLVKQGVLKYGIDMDVTHYEDGKRTTPSSEPAMAGKVATVDEVQSMMDKNGCSVRLLSPQRYVDKLHKLLAGLESVWQYGAGCNIYYTPKGTQGFAPHYDDIEAFIIQLEGQKRWRVYRPTERTGGALPRYSSGNFSENVIGEPVMDITLNPGDMLYFPRGWVHQAVASREATTHSLHATLSTAQRHSWCDFMEILLPTVSQAAFEDQLEIRRSLPRGYQRYMGVVHSETQSEERIQFIEKAVEIFQSMIESMNFDRAADEMAIKFLHDRQPAVLSKTDKKQLGQVTHQTTLSPKNKVRLLRGPDMFRLTVEDDAAFLYHSCYNSRLYHEKEPQGVEFDVDVAPAIELLLKTYPQPMVVGEDWGIWHLSGLTLTKQEIVEEQLRICNLLHRNHLMLRV